MTRIKIALLYVQGGPNKTDPFKKLITLLFFIIFLEVKDNFLEFCNGYIQC